MCKQKQIKNWIIKRYVFHPNSNFLNIYNSFITAYKPSFLINEFFNPKTDTYFVEVVAPFNHSTTFRNRATYEKFVDGLGFAEKIAISDFYATKTDEERYALFFLASTKKK